MLLTRAKREKQACLSGSKEPDLQDSPMGLNSQIAGRAAASQDAATLLEVHVSAYSRLTCTVIHKFRGRSVLDRQPVRLEQSDFAIVGTTRLCA